MGSEWDLYKISYSELYDIPDVEYIEGLQHIFGERMGKLLNSIVIRTKIFPLNFFLKRYFVRTFSKVNKPICLILFANWVLYDLSFDFVSDIKKKHPNFKVVCFFQDLVKSRNISQQKLNNAKEKYDLNISFDYGDCEKYGMQYHSLLFSDVSSQYDYKIENDIYFLGKAKNRLKDILSVYTFLKSKNLRLDFNLVGVPYGQQEFRDEINYIESMPYDENLKHVAKSKCLLEVMQKTGTGFTSRVNEAICFGKRIITNNTMIKNAPFYNSNFISVFDDRFELDEKFLSELNDEVVVNYHYKDKLSPVSFLSFIEERL